MSSAGGAHYVGVDAGTSACKAVAIDRNAKVLASAWRPYSTRRRSNGEVTQDAGDWLAAVTSVVAECAAAVSPRTVEALSVTAPAHNVVLVAADGEPLERVLLWSDRRCAEDGAALQRSLGSELFERTFVPLEAGATLPQLVWLRRQRPELWPQIREVLPAKDFLRRSMTGETCTDPSDAAGTAMYDQLRGVWDEDALATAGLRAAALPPIRRSIDLGGGLNARWAARVGLPAGTPVAVGATDTAAELVAAGAVEPGAALVKIASTGTAVAVSGRPRPDRRVLTYPHATEGRWYTVAATNTAATAYGWLRSALFESAEIAPSTLYKTMDAVASEIPPGAGGVLFLPFLEGERAPFWDADLRATFLGLCSGHTRGSLCRAVLEGVAFSLRSCRDLLASLGLPTRRPVLGGGGMASAVWREILVAVLGEDGVLREPQGPALGAAMLAARAVGAPVPLGDSADINDATIASRADWRARYEELYEVYSSACAAVTEVSHELAQLARRAEPITSSAPAAPQSSALR